MGGQDEKHIDRRMCLSTIVIEAVLVIEFCLIIS